MMIVKFGSYSHEIGQANVEAFSQRVVFGPRGTPLYNVKEMAVTGFVKGSTPASINTLALAVENGYGKVVGDAGLYFDDGSPTLHLLKHSTSRSGVQVVELSYPKGDSAEFATQRQFSIRLRAEYDIAAGSQLIDYSEVVTVRGTGGPRYVMHEFARGSTEPEEVTSQTAVQIIQQGTALGYSAPPNPNPPMSGLGVLQGPATVIARKAPQLVGNAFRNYGVQWSYEFLASGAVSAQPLAR